MRITVLGATGGVGGEVVKQALDRGWHVTAVVRDPAKLKLPAEVVVAGLHEQEKLTAAIEGRDAVLSALGSRDRQPTTVCTDGARAALAAGAKRLLVVSASGLDADGDGVFTRTLVKPLLNTVLKHGYADMRAMEDLVMTSDADWTVVRPPMLLNGPRTGVVKSRLDGNVRGSYTIRRADVAEYLLDAVADPTLIRRKVSIAHG
ncbi:NAD(P)H-binding protein [Amycolatopsis sp. SID8362]|uniref:NAD(P)-dependent oxidoreductase n=1 Tax=Amycolatopsis sp. SID8362 TaxID=2690346 RepID=UPI00136C905B|nr:NAD(P)H-binding protein [Amycolatopsis sp. SID8362]NBH02043.1 NAD(P)H-binding protein [Amycolatopsis sp. SID8362]NED38746.1 NAD(P)H-binding protein [Amycolatopsis sp. SID8362]